MISVWSVLQVHLGEEDLSVLMKILVENIGEGNHAHDLAMSKQGGPGGEPLCGGARFRAYINND